MDPKIAAAVATAVFEYMQQEESFSEPGKRQQKTWSSSGRREIMHSAEMLRSRKASRWADLGRPGIKLEKLD